MADVFTKAKRSEVMGRIRSSGNKETEVALAKILRRHRISGWRRQVEIRGRDVAPRRPRPVQGRNSGVATLNASRTARRSVPTFRVRPDFVFRRSRLAMFVDGCFWHGCPKHGTRPRHNRRFWDRKFSANFARDQRVNRTLRAQGWRVLRIWEHELAKRNEARLVRRLRQRLGGEGRQSRGRKEAQKPQKNTARQNRNQ